MHGIHGVKVGKNNQKAPLTNTNSGKFVKSFKIRFFEFCFQIVQQIIDFAKLFEVLHNVAKVSNIWPPKSIFMVLPKSMEQ